MRISHYLLTAAAMLALACGATAASEPLQPSRPMPDRWIYQPEAGQILPDDDDWWRRFEDPTLDSLIRMAAENNYDLRQAAHRREMARIAVDQARSGYWPSLSVSASYGRTREAGINANSFRTGAQMNWEIDIFGRITASVRNKQESLRASRAEYTGALVSMAAQAATYYVDYRVLQTHLKIAEEHIAKQEKVLKIAEARHEAGLVSKLDVAQAKTVFLSTQASVPQIRQSLRQTLTALAILLGRYPGEIEPLVDGPASLPQYRQIVPAGVPADLLRRRPDIIAAEAELAAGAAAVGIAKKEFMPRLTLTGEVGLSSDRIKELGKSQSLVYSVTPALSWTLFDGFSRRAGVAQAKEQMASLMDSYNLAVLNAVGEADNAMSAYRSAIDAIDIDNDLLEQSAEAFSLSMEQYKQGLTGFNNVVDAQIDWLNTANSLATAKGNALVALIDLYKALGGSPVL